jgi:hypothetical protein
VCAEDARHIAALRTHCARVQDSDRMREQEARWQLIGAPPETLSVGLPAYSDSMCSLLFEPLG